MGQRLELHEIFVSLLGSRNVYFQPPSTVKLVYPCFVYERDKIDEKRANNSVYNYTFGYTVTYIDPDPDNDKIIAKMLALPHCRFVRHFTKDNLNHDLFSIYY